VTVWDDLEGPANNAPLFYVQPPDGEKRLTELMRVIAFRRLARIALPRVMIWANANAGKRNPNQARNEGIMAGVFDYTAAWAPGRIAFIEFKGYATSGRPGSLSPSQIEFGNKMHRLGHSVSAWYSAADAVVWLNDIIASPPATAEQI
jgi:hypothetical protein